MRANNVVIYISYPFIIVAALMSALSEDFTAGVCFILIHEVSHLSALYFFGGDISEIRLKLCEIRIMRYDELRKSQSAFVSAAGPLANILVGAISMMFCRADYAFINFTLAFINLLPLSPFDGYNIWNFRGRKIHIIFSVFSFLILFLLSIIAAVVTMNISLLIIFLTVALYSFPTLSCKNNL